MAKKLLGKIIPVLIAAAVLFAVFWWGGNSPGARGFDVLNDDDLSRKKETETAKDENANDKAPVLDKYMTEPIPDGRPGPFEPQDAIITDRVLTCTLSIRCDTLLDNLDMLDKQKIELVPDDGVIFAEKTVSFYDGESVLELLVREMKRGGIHMEYAETPIYNSAYIEGINNLYEFDGGELSGWMYRVNGWFPNYGCSRYRLREGDRVEWVYTCVLGKDVGGEYSARNGG